MSSLWGLRKQPRINQDANVFRYGRLAYLELGGELRDSASLPGGQAQDLAPGLAGKRAKDAVESVDLSVTHSLTVVLPAPFHPRHRSWLPSPSRTKTLKPDTLAPRVSARYGLAFIFGLLTPRTFESHGTGHFISKGKPGREIRHPLFTATLATRFSPN